MIFDGNDLTKVLGPIVRKEMTAAFFEASMALQKKEVRYFPPEVNLLELLEKPADEGGLTKEESDFYDATIMRQMKKLQLVEEKKYKDRVKAENYERMGPTYEDLKKNPKALEQWQAEQKKREDFRNAEKAKVDAANAKAARAARGEQW